MPRDSRVRNAVRQRAVRRRCRGRGALRSGDFPVGGGRVEDSLHQLAAVGGAGERQRPAGDALQEPARRPHHGPYDAGDGRAALGTRPAPRSRR